MNSRSRALASVMGVQLHEVRANPPLYMLTCTPTFSHVSPSLTIDLVRGTPNHEPVMSALRVPIEIVLRIIALANAPSPDFKLLRSCSLVCKAWSAHAQKMLFRSVSISTHREYTALVSSFKPRTPHGTTSTVMVRQSHPMKPPPSIKGLSNFLPTPDSFHPNVLRGSVIQLNVIIDFNQPDGLTFKKLSHIVSLCPNLRKIGISLFGTQPRGTDAEGTADRWGMRRIAPPVPDEVLEELRTAPNASRISELRVHDWSDDPEILTQLLGIWPRITSLKIAGKLPTVKHGINPAFPANPLGAAPCALETLSFNCATGTEASVDSVKWLLAGSQHTLRRLEFLREPSAKLLEDIFARSTFPLDSISLPNCTCPAIGQIIRGRLESTFVQVPRDNGKTDEANAFRQIQGLEEVFIEGSSTPLTFLVSVVRSKAIRRFGFGVDGRTDLSSLAHAIKAQEGLKRISVWLSNGGERNFGLGSLRIACAIKGIELEEIREIRGFRARKA
ncbi:hypothetical protein BJ322DRAFT_737428 [Thelephora terrestris]|uniref:F-box domain-containing protein n=1 Tax=Thelephora terrestris TaxID=56493 RepID=A0A9P6L6N7_9AGAM|nr:hypothetical protein BJ322DRAFT_737428 [Thelephora terrestris]